MSQTALKNNYKVLILGAGSGGISVAAKLAKDIDDGDMALIDPSENHYYQPFWTLAGAGIVDKTVTEKKQKDLIPNGVDWIQESVQIVQPEKNTVILNSGREVQYEYLIIATGLKLNWDSIQGLQGNLGRNGIGSIYHYDVVDKTSEMIHNFKGGKAIFVMPPVPIKCAGAPQKIMYLADHVFRNNGVREKSDIYFATAGKAMFGIPTFGNALAAIAKEKGIHPLFAHKLISVDAENKKAVFDVTDADGKVTRETQSYDFLHVVPTMSAHSYVAESGLAFTDGDQKGWLAVNKETLQHLKFPNIFGIGDVTGVPNSKTGAAIRVQYPIVAANLLSVMKDETPEEKYNGYSSCPLITEIGKVMLAEFGYDGKLMPTFPLDPTIPRRSYWHLKKDLLPLLYWHGMLKGWA